MKPPFKIKLIKRAKPLGYDEGAEFQKAWGNFVNEVLKALTPLLQPICNLLKKILG